MKKTVLGIVFGADLFNGLIWFVLLILILPHMGLSVPHGILTWRYFSIPLPDERLFALGIAALAAVLPDTDFAAYTLVRKGMLYLLVQLGLAGFVASVGIFAEAILLSGAIKPSIVYLGLVGLLATIVAYEARRKAIRRASHWPIGHYPIPMTLIAALLTWGLAHDFAPDQVLFYELLVVPLVVAHFLHDGIQPQGHPYRAPFSDVHYRWLGLEAKPFAFAHVPQDVVEAHYHQQAERERSLSAQQTAAWRSGTVTPLRVALLLIATCLVIATLIFS